MPFLPDAIHLASLPLAPQRFQPAGADLPLMGLTVLAVEDSRFASDALRLMCRHSGARLRRAETLEAARAHLRVYRPDVVLVDLGLPDGRGEGLIRDLAAVPQNRPAVLGMSGDAAGRDAALAAGADGFIDKPVASLADFQAHLRSTLPDRADGPGAMPASGAALHADPLALADDLALAAAALTSGPGPLQRRYLAGFLTGIARQTDDAELALASKVLADPDASLHKLSHLLQQRLDRSAPFDPAAH